MSTHIDLTSQADVYRETPQRTSDKATDPAFRYAISLTIEHAPMALSRVFGLGVCAVEAQRAMATAVQWGIHNFIAPIGVGEVRVDEDLVGR